MSQQSASKTIAIFEDDINIAYVLEGALELEGYKTVVVDILGVKRGKIDPVLSIKESKPDIIFFSIGAPYRLNWDFFQQIKRLEGINEIPVIITTTGKKDVTQIAGTDFPYRVIEKPFDLQDVIDTVNDEIRSQEEGNLGRGKEREF